MPETPTPHKARGTFTQVPNVFLDTCDLPETAQILFLRLSRHFAYNNGKFTGSIRKLSSLVRLSKSTTDRMIKRLHQARLINLASVPGSESDHAVMIITLATEELWELNEYHTNVEAVSPWDTSLPSCPKGCPNLGLSVPKTGRQDSNLGQDMRNLGQTVPRLSVKESAIRSNTINTKNTKKEEEHAPTHPIWPLWCQAHYGTGTVITSLSNKNLQHCKSLEHICQQHKQELTVPLIQAVEQWAREQYGYKKYWLGNLVNDLPDYLQSQGEHVGPGEQERPELTEGEEQEQVLWTDHPDGAFAFKGTIAQMTQTGILKRMSHKAARAHGYDLPGAYHFDAQEEAEYDAVRAKMREASQAVRRRQDQLSA